MPPSHTPPTFEIRCHKCGDQCMAVYPGPRSHFFVWHGWRGRVLRPIVRLLYGKASRIELGEKVRFGP